MISWKSLKNGEFYKSNIPGADLYPVNPVAQKKILDLRFHFVFLGVLNSPT